jgi:hypothetical protein
VFFVRRLQLARNPDLAFTFLMLNHGVEGASLHCEMSEHDDDWAVKLEVPKGMESPLDPLVYAKSNEAVNNVWERVRASAERPRRLGRANALVARNLLLGPEIPSLEGKSAAAVALRATGWVAWVDRCLLGEGSLRGGGAPGAAHVDRGAQEWARRARGGGGAAADAVAVAVAVVDCARLRGLIFFF